MSGPRKLLISAVEPSGDRLAAELIAALRERLPVEAAGVAGPRMREAGVAPLARAEDMAAMGLAEVLAHLPKIRRIRAIMRDAIDAGADALVVVDGPDFHLPLARHAKARGIPAIGYVSPQVWAWRPGRVKAISAALDQLLCLFAFEPALYPDLDARWVGHPLQDRLPPRGQVDPALYGLLPGSRPQELQRLLPVFLDAAEQIRARQPGARFRLSTPLPLGALPPWVEVAPGGAAAMRDARAALTKSGTVTLELAVLGVPMVVAHRVHPLTYAVGRLLVRGVSHLALPNILAKREVVPEFVQRLDPERLAQAVLDLPPAQPVDLSALGPPGAAGRAADALAERLK